MPILRENIDSKYKWNLEKIYKNNKDFENELENISKKIENIKSYQGKILDSSDNLYNLFEEMNSYDMVLARLYVYAKMRLDEDASKDIYKDYVGRVQNVLTKFSTLTSYIEPELLEANYDLVQNILNKIKG